MHYKGSQVFSRIRITRIQFLDRAQPDVAVCLLKFATKSADITQLHFTVLRTCCFAASDCIYVIYFIVQFIILPYNNAIFKVTVSGANIE
jgi:hypothetical protein